ncbi:MAG TPA: PIN domain-containing protein [Thermoanaerobaculia bacterium]|nr:PIN domain-containing protein [Thermoanaerobaculia bacterium]
MREYFVDAWLIIAAIDREDEHHTRARRIGAVVRGARLITHDAVLTEVLAFFCEEGARPRAAAVDAVRLAQREWIVVPVDRELFDLGLDRYAARPDKEWSHVDCMSMVVMEQRGITHVLTNDHHFAQAGFTVVNE